MLTTLFYRMPRLTLLLIGLILITGAFTYQKVGRQEDPILTKRYGSVEVYWPGSDALRMETQITRPLEDALREIPEIKDFETTSGPGYVFGGIELNDNINDVEIYWSKIRSKMQEVATQFPDGATDPEITERSATAVTQVISFSWTRDDAPQMDILTRIAEDFADHMRNLNGTREVLVYGNAEEEIQVELDATQLSAAGLSVADVSAAIRRADAKIPAGQLRHGSNDLLIEVAGEFKQVEQIRNVPIARLSDGRLLKVGDIADVERGTIEPPRTMAFDSDTRAVFVSVEMEANRRIDAWSKLAHEEFDNYQSKVPPGIEMKLLFNQEIYTNDRLDGLIDNLIFGAINVIVVLMFTLGIRSSLLISVSLPLTVCVVITFYTITGIPLMQTSMVGIIVALGLLIDNSVVVVDDYYAMRREGYGVEESIKKVVSHLFSPLFASTFTTVLAFAPIFLMPGGGGEFVGPMALGVTVAIITSFFIAMTIVPAITGFATRRSVRPHHEKSSWWRDGFYNETLGQIYMKSLQGVTRFPLVGIGVSIVVPILGFVFAGELKEQFFPANDRDMMQVQVELPTVVSIEETKRTVDQIRETLEADDAVVTTYWTIGGGVPRVYYAIAAQASGVASSAQGIIITKSAETTLYESERLQRTLMEKFPNARVMAMPFEQGPPASAPVEVRVIGPELSKLRELGDKIRLYLDEVPEITYSRAQLARGAPKLKMDIDPDLADLAGLTPVDIARDLNNTLEGAVGGSILEGEEELPVRVRVPGSIRGDLSEIQSQYIQPSNPALRTIGADSPGIPLYALGPDFDVEPEVASISHYNGERVNTVQAFLLPFKLPAVAVEKLMKRMEEDGFELPPDYRLSIGGESEQRGETVGNLTTFAVPLLILMIGLVVLSFNSFVNGAVIFMVAFLSVGLALFSLWVFDIPFGFIGVVGTMGLIGVAINGAIVVLTALRSSEEAKAGDKDEAVKVVFRATRHILSTTLTTIGGFSPLLITGGRFWEPLATAIAGGIAWSALLALYFTPAMFQLIQARSLKRAVRQAEKEKHFAAAE